MVKVKTKWVYNRDETIEINSEVIDTKNYKSNFEFCVPRPEYNKKLIL